MILSARQRSSNRKGKQLSPEHKAKLSIDNKGKKLSQETINKMKNRTGEKNVFYGKKHSEETKAKIRETKRIAYVKTSRV
jgi:hypothetical protein